MNGLATIEATSLVARPPIKEPGPFVPPEFLEFGSFLGGPIAWSFYLVMVLWLGIGLRNTRMRTDQAKPFSNISQVLSVCSFFCILEFCCGLVATFKYANSAVPLPLIYLLVGNIWQSCYTIIWMCLISCIVILMPGGDALVRKKR